MSDAAALPGRMSLVVAPSDEGYADRILLPNAWLGEWANVRRYSMASLR